MKIKENGKAYDVESDFEACLLFLVFVITFVACLKILGKVLPLCVSYYRCLNLCGVLSGTPSPLGLLVPGCTCLNLGVPEASEERQPHWPHASPVVAAFRGFSGFPGMLLDSGQAVITWPQ